MELVRDMGSMYIWACRCMYVKGFQKYFISKQKFGNS